MKSDTYSLLRSRLNAASTAAALNRVEQQATRLYNAGLITVRELTRIDIAVMERLAKLEIGA